MLLLGQSVHMGIARGWSAFRRDRQWGMLGLFLCAMALLQTLVACIVALYGVDAFFRSQTALHLEVAAAAPDQDIQELYGVLQDLSYVRNVTLVSSEQAYELERRRSPGLITTLESFKLPNPFPDAFVVTLDSLAYQSELLGVIGQERWSRVIAPSFVSSLAGQTQELAGQQTTASLLLGVFLLLLVLGFGLLLFLLVDLVRRRARARREDLHLESLLGASPTDILAPLVTEMTAMLFASLLLASGAVAIVLFFVPMLFSSAADGGVFTAALESVTPLLTVVFPLCVILEALLLPALGTGGALLGISLRTLIPAPARS